MSLALSEAQYSQFLQFLKKEGGSLPIRKAVTLVGQQKDVPVWVLNKDIHINAEGQVVPEEEQQYMWLQETILDSVTCVSLIDVIPQVHLPLGTSVLHSVAHHRISTLHDMHIVNPVL